MAHDDGKSLAHHLGRRIRQLREEKGFDRRELAERIGLSLSMISVLESGGSNTRTEVLDRLAFALDVGVADLFVFPWPDDDDADDLPARDHVRELIRMVPDSKLAPLVKMITEYAMPFNPGLQLARRRAK